MATFYGGLASGFDGSHVVCDTGWGVLQTGCSPLYHSMMDPTGAAEYTNVFQTAMTLSVKKA
jgi:hypothetical protein